MSRFIDMLHRASEAGGHSPLGFGRAAQEKVPTLLPVPVLPSPDKGLVNAALDAGAEALLITLEGTKADLKSLDTLPDRAKEVPWGIQLAAPSEELVQSLKEKGCDFLVLPLEATPLLVLREEEMGKVLVVDTSLEERLARGIEQLSVDALLTRASAQGPLTAASLLELLYLFSLSGAHLLVPLPPEWTRADLEELRDQGVSGVMLPVADRQQAEEMRRLKETVEDLAPRKRRRSGDTHARVTYPAVSRASEPDEEEEDDDDDY